MGEKLYVFYDPPLHIVKGEGVWLTASDGRRYLDCYNNVPHVGHCHPYVAEAIARQARTLNTNTRYITDQSIEYAERLAELVVRGAHLGCLRQLRQRGERPRLAHGEGLHRPYRRTCDGIRLSRRERGD